MKGPRARGAHEILFPAFSMYHPRTGHPDWYALFKDAAALAIKVLPGMVRTGHGFNTFTHSRRRIMGILKTLKNLVKNKYKMARHDHNFIPLFYIWTMTNACNFICTYCSNHRDGKYPLLYKKGGAHRKNLDTLQGKRLLHVMREASAIYWCGGEPTLRKDLPELLDYSTKVGMFNMINTNGSLLGDLLVKPAYRNFLAQMDVVIISLDALDTKALAKMYNVHESIARNVIRNLLALRVLRHFVPFKLVANVVITKDNITEANDVIDFCCDLGITLAPVSGNIGSSADASLINDPAYQVLVDKILERARDGYPMIASAKLLDRVLHGRIEHCYPVVFDHVDHDGTIYWPCKAYPAAIKQPLLNFDNVMQAHDEASKKLNPAFFHGKGKEKCNGSCQWMQNCVTEAYGSALVEGFIEGGLFKEIRGLLS